MSGGNRRRHFVNTRKGQSMVDGSTTDSDLQFVALVRARQYGDALALAEDVGDINVRDPELDATALHLAAARAASNFIKALHQARPDLDFLALDGNGKRASEIAWHDARDEALGAWLMEQEKRQATLQGVPPWPVQEPD